MALHKYNETISSIKILKVVTKSCIFLSENVFISSSFGAQYVYESVKLELVSTCAS